MIRAAERELEGAGVKKRPEVVLADAGYWSNDHSDALRERGMIPILAPDATRNRPRKTRRGGPYDFMRGVLASERGAALHSKRMPMVERVFARIKANRRIDRLKRRGRAAARSEWRLIAATHHLVKLHRSGLAPAGGSRSASRRLRGAAWLRFTGIRATPSRGSSTAHDERGRLRVVHSERLRDRARIRSLVVRSGNDGGVLEWPRRGFRRG